MKPEGLAKGVDVIKFPPMNLENPSSDGGLSNEGERLLEGTSQPLGEISEDAGCPKLWSEGLRARKVGLGDKLGLFCGHCPFWSTERTCLCFLRRGLDRGFRTVLE